MQFEQGKTYLDGMGERITITHVGAVKAGFPVIGERENGNIRRYTAEGKWNTDGEPHRLDLQFETEPSEPAPEHIMQFFAFEHLPPTLRDVSRQFAALANNVVTTLPRNPERTVALRKLLEAKDAAVRAQIAK